MSVDAVIADRQLPLSLFFFPLVIGLFFIIIFYYFVLFMKKRERGRVREETEGPSSVFSLSLLLVLFPPLLPLLPHFPSLPPLAFSLFTSSLY